MTPHSSLATALRLRKATAISREGICLWERRHLACSRKGVSPWNGQVGCLRSRKVGKKLTVTAIVCSDGPSRPIEGGRTVSILFDWSLNTLTTAEWHHWARLPPTRVAITSLNVAEATPAGGAAEAHLEYLLTRSNEIA